MKFAGLVALLAALLILAGCGAAAPTATPVPALLPTPPPPQGAAPATVAPPGSAATSAPAAPAASGSVDHITLQHILIGFQGSIPGKNITRTKDEAKALANEVYAKAQSGADFDALVQQYTDDAPPGIYSLSNTGVPPGPGEYPREGMVPAFGNVGFSLKVGQIGIAVYDPATSPYGWHIIKRLK